MRRAFVAALALLATALLASASPAAGQSTTAPPPDSLPEYASTRTPLLSLGGGLATPSGPDGLTSGRGFQAGATGVFPVAGRLGIEIHAAYVRLSSDQDFALTGLGIDPSTFVAGGGLLEGGYRRTGAVTAGVRLLLRGRDRRVLPHVSAGAGYAVAGVADQNLLFLGERETLMGASEGGPAVSFGAGVEVQVRNGVGVFGAARFLRVFTEPRLTAVMPFTLGVSLRLEERQRPAPRPAALPAGNQHDLVPAG